jgi:hypothetical protein
MSGDYHEPGNVRDDCNAADMSECPNGPDEDGNWPCNPKGYFGVAECQVCGWIGAWSEVARHAR